MIKIKIKRGDINTYDKMLFCDKEMIWNIDYTKEDYGLEGKGLVVSLSCLNCGASCDFYEGEEE